MNSFSLKIIACISMFIDHLRYIIPTKPLFMAYIGRLAFPIFAFQSVQGYAHSKNIKKYLLRILIFALISQIPYHFYFKINAPNVLFTLFLGLLCIHIYEILKNNKAIAFTLIIGIMALSESIDTDYGFYGISIMLIFHIFKNKKILMTFNFIIMTLVFFIFTYKIYNLQTTAIILFVCTLFGIIPCLLYNGKQGPKAKYLFYFFYPVHILLLLLVSFF